MTEKWNRNHTVLVEVKRTSAIIRLINLVNTSAIRFSRSRCLALF